MQRARTRLKLPSALPFILGGLKIAGGLSLIGAVVAEIAAGSAGAGSGLAYRIAESSYRLNVPRMFAALILLSPLIWRGRREFFRLQRPWLQLLRAILSTLEVAAFFLASNFAMG